MRICSLLPGATEVVAALGRARHLVGISHECDYPPEIRTKPVLVRATVDPERLSSAEIDRRVRAGLKDGASLYELDEILFGRVRPSLIITQDLCHACAVTPAQLKRAIHALPSPPRVLSLSPSTLDDVLADIERIGDAIGRADEASVLAEQLRSRLEAVLLRVAHAETRPRVACLEWLDPLYAAGHWVPEMVACAGGVDALGTLGSPSVQVTWEQVQTAQPDALIVMPCGFSIARSMRELECLTTKPGWGDLPAVRHGDVFVVEAPAYFNRPGPRLIDGVEILAACLFPSLVPEIRAEAVQRLGEQEWRALPGRAPVS